MLILIRRLWSAHRRNAWMLAISAAILGFNAHHASAQSTTYTYFACTADDQVTRINATDTVTITKPWATPTDPGVIQFSTNVFDVCPQDVWAGLPAQREFLYFGTANSVFVKLTSPAFNIDPPVFSSAHFILNVVFKQQINGPLLTNPTATIFFFTDPSQTGTSTLTFPYGLTTDFSFGRPVGGRVIERFNDFSA